MLKNMFIVSNNKEVVNRHFKDGMGVSYPWSPAMKLSWFVVLIIGAVGSL